MKQQNKSVITLQDFVFYVIYSKCGGYGFHDKATLRKSIVADLKGVPSVNGYRFHQCDWTPISGMMAEGMAELKYDGVTTVAGVVELVNNGYLYRAENTMGSISIDFGHQPAVSLEDDYETPYYMVSTSKAELKRIFRSNYYDSIGELQGVQHSQAYITPMVLNERLDEACIAAYGQKYAELTGSKKQLADVKFEKISNLLYTMMGWLHDVANNSGDAPELDKSAFVVDFRQLELDFQSA